MLIAILNQSTLVTDADASVMIQAVATQVRMDAAPLWDRAPAAVVFYTDPAAVPAAVHDIAIVDTILFIDPNCNLWANDGKGSAYSFEVCDPVKAPTYAVSGPDEARLTQVS